MRTLMAMLLAAGWLAGCTTDENRTPRAEQRWVADGPEVSCISRNSIRGTNIPDNRTINFEAGSRRMFANSLPNECPGLSFNRAIKINSRTSQLCSVDSITVITGGGGQRGATCPLGRFQPMVRVDPPATPPG